MTKKERLINRIIEHKDYIVSQGIAEDRILGVFLYGSQNYNTDTENSDVDTKALIVPTKADAILNPKWYVKEYHLPNGEHCEVMDIRHWVAQLYKQNINFVETLFTEYFWINPKYQFQWNTYFATDVLKEGIAYYDPERGIRSIIGQAIHTLLQKNSLTFKRISNGYRLMFFLCKYAKTTQPYMECLYNPEPTATVLKDIKAGKLDMDIEKEAEELVESFRHLEKIIHIDTDVVKKNLVEKYINNFILACIGD